LIGAGKPFKFVIMLDFHGFDIVSGANARDRGDRLASIPADIPYGRWDRRENCRPWSVFAVPFDERSGNMPPLAPTSLTSRPFDGAGEFRH